MKQSMLRATHLIGTLMVLATLSPALGASLSGTINGPNGALGSATIQLFATDNLTQASYTTVSTNDGVFNFDTLLARSYFIKLTHPNYPVQWFNSYGTSTRHPESNLMLGNEGHYSYTMLLVDTPFNNSPTARLKFIGVDNNGAGVKDVKTIMLWKPMSNTSYYFYADSAGFSQSGNVYMIDSIPGGDFFIGASTERYPHQFYHPTRNTESGMTTVTLPSDSIVSLQFKFTDTPVGYGVISGTLRDSSGALLSAVSVALYSSPTDPPIRQTTSTAQGEFRFDTLYSSRGYYIKAWSTNFAPQWYSHEGMLADPSYPLWIIGQNLTLILSTQPKKIYPPDYTAWLEGTIKDSRGGGVGAAVVEVIDPNGGVVNSDTTDNTGRYRIGPIPPYTHYLRASSTSFTLQYWNAKYPTTSFASRYGSFSAPSHDTLFMDITVQNTPLSQISQDSSTGTGIVSGSVKVEGVAKPGVMVHLWQRNGSGWFETVTTNSGTFKLINIPAGEWQLDVYKEGYFLQPGSTPATFTIKASQTITLTEYLLIKGGFLAGSFANPSGDALLALEAPFSQVYLYPEFSTSGDTLRRPQHVCGFYRQDPHSFLCGPIPPGRWRPVFIPALPNGFETAIQSQPSYSWSSLAGQRDLDSLPIVSVNSGDTLGGLSVPLTRGIAVRMHIKPQTPTAQYPWYHATLYARSNKRLFEVCQPFFQNQIPGMVAFAGINPAANYFLRVDMDGYPSQFCAPSGSSATATTPLTVSAGSALPQTVTVLSQPAGYNPYQNNYQEPLSLWLKSNPTKTGLILNVNVSSTSGIDSITVFRQAEAGTPQVAYKTLVGAQQYNFTWEEPPLSGNYRYVAVGNTDSLKLRSRVSWWDFRSASLGLNDVWIDARGNRGGVRIDFGISDSLARTQRDSVYLYRRYGTYASSIIDKRPLFEKSVHDWQWDAEKHRGVTFYYRVKIVFANGLSLSSTEVPFTISDAFIASIPHRLHVGTKHPYQSIQAAIDAASPGSEIIVHSKGAQAYTERLRLGTKRLTLQGDWEGSFPPIIDAGGGIAISVDYAPTDDAAQGVRISGFIIRNAQLGVQSASSLQFSNCLFTKTITALKAVPNAVAMSAALAANPFLANEISLDLWECTAINTSPGATVFAGSSIPSSWIQQHQAPGVYNWALLSPAPPFSARFNLSGGLVQGYQKPISVADSLCAVSIHRSAFWQSQLPYGSSNIFIDTSVSTTLQPLFSDTSYYFLAENSVLYKQNTSYYLGYDRWHHEQTSGPSEDPGKSRPSSVRTVVATEFGFKAVGLSWSAAPDSEKVATYIVYRLPGDPALFTNINGLWELTIPNERFDSVATRFSTPNTFFVDTTIALGIPYLYAVAAVDSAGQEGQGPQFSSAQPIKSYFTNTFDRTHTLIANRWQMLGTWGKEALSFVNDSSEALYRWDARRQPDKLYDRYVNSQTIAPTIGYWALSSTPRLLQVSSQSLQSIATQPSVACSLWSGWNMIASPYPFAITPQWLRSAVLWQWSATESSYKIAETMKPWNGYWLYMAKDTVVSFSQPSRQQIISELTAGLKKQLASEGWNLRLALTTSQGSDNENFVGAAPRGLAKAALQRSPEPPAAFDNPHLYIISSGGEQLASHIVTAPQVPAHKLEWTIGVSALSTSATLTIHGLNALPKQLNLFWIRQGTITELNTDSIISLPPSSHPQVGYLVATANRSEIALYGGALALHRAYPNPFRGATTIDFTIPYGWNGDGSKQEGEAYQTQLTLFTLNGKVARRLVNGPLKVGTHRLVWDGRDEQGHSVASGFYLVRLEAGETSKTLKLFRAR